MKKLGILFIASFILSGCVTLQKVSVPEDRPEEVVHESPKALLELPDTSPELENIKSEELEGYVEKKGIIFAKTDFQGLLKTRYVKFLLQDLEDPMHKFQLNIGKNSDQKISQGGIKAVKPGYFFVELPAGRYKISSISIPVGSTVATEAMDVTLEVIPNTICYVGTLKMVGTKEKIKLGGLPVIKPGFEYTVEVLDEREEGADAFRQNYPDFPHDVSIKLMQVNVLPSKK